MGARKDPPSYPELGGGVLCAPRPSVQAGAELGFGGFGVEAQPW